MRIHWDNLKEPSFLSRWNPWSTEVPYVTFMEHPVKGSTQRFGAICQVRSISPSGQQIKAAVVGPQDGDKLVCRGTKRTEADLIAEAMGCLPLQFGSYLHPRFADGAIPVCEDYGERGQMRIKVNQRPLHLNKLEHSWFPGLFSLTLILGSRPLSATLALNTAPHAGNALYPSMPRSSTPVHSQARNGCVP